MGTIPVVRISTDGTHLQAGQDCTGRHRLSIYSTAQRSVVDLLIFLSYS